MRVNFLYKDSSLYDQVMQSLLVENESRFHFCNYQTWVDVTSRR